MTLNEAIEFGARIYELGLIKLPFSLMAIGFLVWMIRDLKHTRDKG